ncbi:MAG TPA: hypothetical protein VKX46_00110, partial [Ktedonobacteraceae bacterium]|nr:hypothetical protein [Ktedonobacteraceae bacterium]
MAEYFGQINYKQDVGNSHLGIDEIGCFVAAFCNTLEKVGKTVDPPTLNTFFTDHGVYLYDVTDRANDDLTWSSITKYCPQLVVGQIGTSGWPSEDLSIVEFRYKSHTGAIVTHFCAVNHAS